MRTVLILALACLASGVQTAAAQLKTYKWDDAVCSNTVRYDPRKVDGMALQNTALLLASGGSPVPLIGFVGTLDDVRVLDPDGFETKCRAEADKLRSQTLLPLEGLAALHQERVRQIEDACRFGAAYARGYRTPSALRGYAPASPHCDRFVDAMEGKVDMTSFWRQEIAKNCRNNASPTACRQRYEAQGNGPDGDAWKRLYLNGFGWNNCATEYTAFNGDGATRRDAMMERLGKLFRRTYRVKQSCDEP